MIRLIVSDLDDTLLNPRSALSLRTRDALRAAVAAGALVTFATGRMLESSLSLAEEIGVNAPLILYNGALIHDLRTGRTVSRLDIPADIARRICRLAEDMGVYMQAYPGENYYCATRCEFTARYAASIRIDALETPGHQPLSEWISSSQAKLLALGEAEDMPPVLEAFRRAFAGEGVDFFMSRASYMEIVSSRASKQSALKTLAEALDVAPEEILAFGDGENDAGMLEYAGQGYAMANAREDVRRRARFVAPSNADDGAAQVVEALLAKGEIGRGNAQ